MLAQLASRLHARRAPAGNGEAGNGDDDDGDEEGRMLLLDDNCEVGVLTLLNLLEYRGKCGF